MTKSFPTDRIVSGSLCYIVRDDQVLLLRRNRPPHVGLWTPPGGKMHIGESPHECAVRELFEETGLTIIQPTLRAIVTVVDIAYPVHWLLFIFRADEASGDLIASPEGELRWVDRNAVEQYPRPAADSHYYPHVMGDGPVFVCKYIYDTPNKLTETVAYM
jgi:8-oxo-dGTP diphosphatase